MTAPKSTHKDHTTRWPIGLFKRLEKKAKRRHRETGERMSINREIRRLVLLGLEHDGS